MPAMADTDELADLRAQLKRLERRQAQAMGEADQNQRLLGARILVLVVTAGLFLSVSMPWYSDIDTDDGSSELVSGWGVFSLAAGESGEPALVFGGVYSWVVVLAALAAGAAVLEVTRRWVAITMSTLLTLLTLGQLVLNSMVASDEAEQLAGTWCAVVVMVAGAFAWGNLVVPLRELAVRSL
jgi:hypothetical protein